MHDSCIPFPERNTASDGSFHRKPLHIAARLRYPSLPSICSLCKQTTVSTWLELMALMSYYFARLWKHISSIFGTIGRREHIQRFLTILRNFGMREPINGILNTSLLEIKGRLYRLLHIINEFSHLRIHSFPLINIPS